MSVETRGERYDRLVGVLHRLGPMKADHAYDVFEALLAELEPPLAAMMRRGMVDLHLPGWQDTWYRAKKP